MKKIEEQKKALQPDIVRIDPLMIDEQTAADFLGISKATLVCGRSNGQRDRYMPLPPYYKLGRRILYKKSELENWIEQFRVDAKMQQKKEAPHRQPHCAGSHQEHNPCLII
jgi:hypothetical protein